MYVSICELRLETVQKIYAAGLEFFLDAMASLINFLIKNPLKYVKFVASLNSGMKM